jgi:hypothetical protein
MAGKKDMSPPHGSESCSTCQTKTRHAADDEPIEAPFRVIANIHEAIDGWQFARVSDRREPLRYWTAPVEYRYLPVADYTVAGVPLYVFRYNAQEFIKEIRQRPDSITQRLRELEKTQSAGNSCLIVLEGVGNSVERVMKAGEFIESSDSSTVDPNKCDIFWLLAETPQLAEQIVFEFMHRTWQRVASL